MTLNSVTYTVSGNGFTKTGTIDTSGSPTTSGTIGGKPPCGPHCYNYTITMLLRLQPDAAAPLYEQIAAQLRRAIVEGKVKEDERLPAARELAESLEVHMHTVLRAYDELRKEGLLEVRRGRGVVVLGSGRGRARLLELARALVSEGTRQGLELRDLRKLLGEV